MSSGYNVATNIYCLPEFNDLCGFRETEIQQALQQVAKHCHMSETELQSAMAIMRQFYIGVLTLDGTTSFGDLKLRIPNLVICNLYVEKLQELLLPEVHYEDYREAKQIFMPTGDLQPLCDFIEPRFAVFSNRDYRWNAEVAVKTAFLMFLFDDRLYIMDSEPELNRCYADLVMIVRPDARQYQILDHLLEFKFLYLNKELNLTAEQVRDLSVEQIGALPQIQSAFAEAGAQLRTYQQILEQIYGTVLQLKTAAVVALGFERLVWQSNF